MKQVLPALAILLLAAVCGAASIEVQESVPASAVWSFSVVLPNGTDFDNAKVFLDGSMLISFDTSSSGKITVDEENEARLFSSTDPVDNRVYFLVSPLAKGSHSIRLEVDGSAEDEESTSFFEINDAEETAGMQDQITNLRGSVNTLVAQLNEIENSLQDALGAEDKAELKAGIAGVESSLASLEAAAEEKGGERDAKINALNGYIRQIEERESEEKQSAATAFFSLPGIRPEMQALVIIAIAAAVAVFLVAKFRDRIPLKKGLYGGMKAGKHSFSQHDDDVAEQIVEEGLRGKWAFGSAPKEKEGERFNLGDLIRK